MNFIQRKPLPRRVFLKGAGGVVLALPFLEASISKAQNIEVPKRFVVWFTPCGVGSSSYPTRMDFTGTAYEPLQPFADRLIVTRGFAMKSIAGQSTPPHPTGFGHMLTGNRCEVRGDDILTAQNESIDQFIANRMGPTRIASSLHGVVNERNMSWARAPSGAVSSLRAEQDPLVAFNRPPGCVRGMERQMDGGRGAAAAPCTVTGAPGRLDARSISSGQQIGRAHLEVLVRALECDITRGGAMQWYSHSAVHGSPYGWDGGL